MDDYIQHIIQRAKLHDPNAWHQISEALARSAVHPNYFYSLVVYIGGLMLTRCRECRGYLHLEQHSGYIEPEDPRGRGEVWVDETDGDACDTPSGQHEPIPNDEATYYFLSKKEALTYFKNLVTSQLIASGDTDLILNNLSKTLVNWKEVFNGDFKIERLEFTNPPVKSKSKFRHNPMKQSILYAHKRPWPQRTHEQKIHPLFGQQMFCDVMTNPNVVNLFDEGKPIFKILVREPDPDETSYYWAWWNNAQQEFEFIHGAKFLVEICFPYGVEPEEKLNRGKLMPVIVEEIDQIKI